MSIEIMRNVWLHSTHRGTDLVAMLALADWAGPDGISYYPLQRLMDRARISGRKGGVRLTGRLVDSGEVYIINRHASSGRQLSNMYCVLPGLEEAQLEEAAARLGVTVALLKTHALIGSTAANSKGEGVPQAPDPTGPKVVKPQIGGRVSPRPPSRVSPRPRSY